MRMIVDDVDNCNFDAYDTEFVLEKMLRIY